MLLTPFETAVIMTASENTLVTTRQVYYRLNMYRVLGVKVGTAIITAAGIGTYSSIKAAGLKPVCGYAKQKNFRLKKCALTGSFQAGLFFYGIARKIQAVFEQGFEFLPIKGAFSIRAFDHFSVPVYQKGGRKGRQFTIYRLEFRCGLDGRKGTAAVFPDLFCRVQRFHIAGCYVYA